MVSGAWPEKGTVCSSDKGEAENISQAKTALSNLVVVCVCIYRYPCLYILFLFIIFVFFVCCL
jgi:hypothetical protein